MGGACFCAPYERSNHFLDSLTGARRGTKGMRVDRKNAGQKTADLRFSVTLAASYLIELVFVLAVFAIFKTH